MTNKRLIAHYKEAKSYAKQIVQAFFGEVLCGTFNVPAQDEMEQSLKDVIVYNFDEYQMISKIKTKHPGWEKDRIDNEVSKKKIKYDKEYLNNLKNAAAEAITEIENLISSLNDTIKAWKIKNLA